MAITKRVRVSFDAKIVVPTDEVDEMILPSLVHLAKRASSGETLSGGELALLEAALTGGADGAVELALKKHVKGSIVDTLNEYTVSNFRFEVKR